jgi:glycosyltransferase involved in cell wall biosynthesis
MRSNIIFLDNLAWSTFHFRREIILELSKNYSVYIVAPSNSEFIVSEEFQNVHYINLTLDRTGKNIFYDLLFVIKLFFLYKKIKPIFTFNYTLKPVLYGSFICNILKINSINILAGLNNSFFNNKWVFKYLFRMLTKSSVFYVALNFEDFRFLTTNNYTSKYKTKLFECGEGVNTKIYKPDNQIIKLYNEVKRFLFVSRILKSKGVFEYLESARLLSKLYPNTEFWICGEFDDSHPDSISKEVFNKYLENTNVKYLGRVPKMIDIYNQCHFFVLPSWYNEGLNRSIMEALSCGLPIITTFNKGCDVFVNKNNGFLVSIRDVNALFAAMEKCTNLDLNSYIFKSSESRKLALNHYDSTIVIKKYLKMIAEL